MPKVASRSKAARPKAPRRKNPHPKTASRAKVVLSLGDSPVIDESENVDSVSEVDAAILVVHFDIPFADELYRCDVIPSEPVTWEIKARKKEGVGIRLATPWPRKIKIVCEQV